MKTRVILTALAAVLALSGMPADAVPPGPPEGNMVWTPGVPMAERDVTFGVSARDPDGPIISIRVDFGDGTSANLATPPRSAVKDASACLFGDRFAGSVLHRYARPGTYAARVTIVGGTCPLSDVIQEVTWTKTYALEVVRATAQSPEHELPGGSVQPAL